MMIATSRLILRKMNTDDYDALYAVLADSDTMQHYPYSFDKKEFVDGLRGIWNGTEFLDLVCGRLF